MDLLKASVNRRKASQIYQPLDPQRNQIRLLTLKAGFGTAFIECTLEVISLDDRANIPAYEALSYTWGDATVTKKILVNRRRLSVTLNLHIALEHFRKSDEDLCLWVDAICVNQCDLKERGEQVRLMRQIFSQAPSTIVWLGPEADDSSKAMDLIDLMDYVFRDCHARHLYANDQWPDATIWGPRESWGVEDHINALIEFLKRPWFFRIWVVQEAAMSQQLVIVCGNNRTTWSKLINVFNFIMMMLSYFQYFDALEGLYRIAYINDILDMHKGINFSQRDEQMGMLVLLVKHRQAQATDPRDKCIALMGLAKGEFQADSANFYSQSVRHLYASTMTELAHQAQEKPLKFLAYAGHPRARNDLPSWVPDWSYTDFTGDAFPWWQIEHPDDSRGLIKPFNLVPGLDVGGLRIFEFANKNSILIASGITVDTIDGYTSTNHRASGMLFPKRPDGADLTVIQPQHEHSQYPTAESIDDVIWRTLVLDRDYLGRSIPTERWKSTLYWLFGKAAINYQSSTENLVQTFLNELWDKYHLFKVGGTAVGDIVRRQAPAELINCVVPDEDEIHHLGSAIASATGGRRLAISDKGYVGLVPTCTQRGDAIAILFGCPVPVILRKHDDWYEFIGTCYIHGIMEGETVVGIENGEYKIQDFEIG